MCQVEEDKLLFERLMNLLSFTGQWNFAFIEAPDLDEVRERFLDRATTFVELGERTFRANNPWHASMWLLRRCMLLADENFMPEQRRLLAAELGLSDLGITVSIFRGQGNPDWCFEPAASRFKRLNPRGRVDHFTHSTDIFCRGIEIAISTLVDDVQLDRLPLLAVAQHYGLPTELLDFTIDPFIAVYFAMRQSATDGTAVVYSLPMQNLLQSGLEIALPPAFARRMYLQKGIFIRVSEPMQCPLRDQCVRIIFPPHPDYEVLKPHTTPNSALGVFPSNPKINRLRNLSRTLALQFPQEDIGALEPLIRDIVQRTRITKAIRREGEVTTAWLAFAETMLTDLALFRNDGVFNIAFDVLDVVARNNIDILNMIARRLNALGVRGNTLEAEIMVWASTREQNRRGGMALPQSMIELLDEEPFLQFLQESFGVTVR